MKSAQLIKKSLLGKNLKAYEKLEQDCNTEEVTVTAEELEALLGSVAEPFDSIGMELEKHMYNARTIYLNDEVSPETVNHLIMLIHKWNYDDATISVDERQPIVIYIDTQGGDVYKGLSLVSAIENSVTPIVGYVDGGICMSMGLPILLSCHYKIVTRHSILLYHTIRANSDVNTLPEIYNTADHYKRVQDMIDNYIVENTDITQEILDEKKYRNLDWYLTLEEIEQYGFADEIL